MGRTLVPLHVFNRGRISSLALARTDLDRTRLSADIQTNFMPRTLGSMMIRPGFGYLSETHNSVDARLGTFIFSSTDTALFEFSSSRVRFYVEDALVKRTFVGTSATNGTFASDLTGWTDADESGASSTWVSGYMELVGTRYSAAKRRQEIAVASTDANKEHGIRITVEQGHPTVKIGSALGNDDYVSETELSKGIYSFVVVPSSNIHVELSANTEYSSYVNSVQFESTAVGLSTENVLSLPAPWGTSDLDNLRMDQSGNVVYMACGSTISQQKIVRLGSGSSTSAWAIVDYLPEDGPFRLVNTSAKRLTPSGLSGNITIQASQPLFRSGHVGALFRITSIGQNVQASITGGDQWTDEIRVTGVDASRVFNLLYTKSTDFTGTMRVQRSVGETGQWTNVSGLSYATTIATTYDDGLDNQIIFYRFGAGSTDVSSTGGTGTVSLTYAAGGIIGIAKITSVSSSTSNNSTAASAIVLKNLGSTAASDLWNEGEWSVYRGYPSAVVFHEGRLWWAGKSKIIGSVSDLFEGFDQDVEGDSAPINRSIASGPVDRIRWLSSLGRLVVGTQGAELQVKTGTLDEPLTPTNFNLRDISTQGSANVQAVKIDKRALMVHRGQTRLFDVSYASTTLDYESGDRTILVPEIGEPSLVRLGVQRQPDTRVHAIRGSTDGTVGVLVSDPAENVTCWIDVETGSADGSDGVVKDVAVLPGTNEDKVYYLVQREVNGSTKIFLEKWAKESEAVGSTLNKIADSFIVYESTATTSIPVSHLIGKSVVAWGNGKDLGTYTVSTLGLITISTESTCTIVGLPYNAWFKSAKLAYASQAGTALTQRKKVTSLGLVLANTHARGLQFGPTTSTDDLRDMPSMENGTAVSTNTIHTVYDEQSFPIPGSYDTDSRVVLKATAPRPCTALGMVIVVDEKDKV